MAAKKIEKSKFLNMFFQKLKNLENFKHLFTYILNIISKCRFEAFNHLSPSLIPFTYRVDQGLAVVLELPSRCRKIDRLRIAPRQPREPSRSRRPSETRETRCRKRY